VYRAAVRQLGTRSHRIAATNLALAFPAAPAVERHAILSAMWRNWGRAMVETSRIASLRRDELRDLVRLDPPDGPREIFARARETGALVLTAHLGSFELLHAACAAHGFPITVVHKTLANRRVDRWLTELRQSAGTRLLRTGAAAQQILRALRCGEVVALPFDQRPRDRSRIFVPFFSLPAATSSGLARLAIASQAPVFPVVLVREGESESHRALFLPAVELRRGGDRQDDAVENTRRFNLVLEELVRRFPEQWIWMYNRWKEHLKGRVPSAWSTTSGATTPALEAVAWRAEQASTR
jgi:KDO2-lipid IV(A) lauroyltransferase